MIVLLNLLGVDVIGWLSDLWDQIKAVPVDYIVAGLVFQTGQTIFAGLSYYGILRAAYPGEVEFWPIVTAYAVGVSMNNFLPGEHRHVRDAADVRRDHPGCDRSPARSPPISCRRSSSPIAGTFVYLYLFLSVPGSFDLNLGNLSEHPVVAIVIAVGVVLADRDRRADLLAAGQEALGCRRSRAA